MAAWTRDDEKKFEHGIADFDPECPDFFENIRGLVPNKTIEEVQEHYQALARDLWMIESGLYDHRLPPMVYVDPYIPIMDQEVEIKEKSGGPWSDKEHREFLDGLERYGRGSWREIARECVLTRTATQVASHAQKYFNKIKKQQEKQECPQPQQHQMNYPQQQECSTSYAQNVDVVLDCNKAETSTNPVLDATVLTPHDASGPEVSDFGGFH